MSTPSITLPSGRKIQVFDHGVAILPNHDTGVWLPKADVAELIEAARQFDPMLKTGPIAELKTATFRPRAYQYAGLLGRYVDISWPEPSPENENKRGGMASWIEAVEDTENGVLIRGDYGMGYEIRADNIDGVKLTVMQSSASFRDRH